MSFLHSLRHVFGLSYFGTIHSYTGVDGKRHMGHFCEDCGKLGSGGVPVANPMRQAIDFLAARSIFYHVCKGDQRCLRQNLENENYIQKGDVLEPYGDASTYPTYPNRRLL